MIVKELIEKLKQMPEEAEVYFEPTKEEGITYEIGSRGRRGAALMIQL